MSLRSRELHCGGWQHPRPRPRRQLHSGHLTGLAIGCKSIYERAPSKMAAAVPFGHDSSAFCNEPATIHREMAAIETLRACRRAAAFSRSLRVARAAQAGRGRSGRDVLHLRARREEDRRRRSRRAGNVWMRGHFALEYKGKHKDLAAAYQKLLLYRG